MSGDKDLETGVTPEFISTPWIADRRRQAQLLRIRIQTVAQAETLICTTIEAHRQAADTADGRKRRKTQRYAGGSDVPAPFFWRTRSMSIVSMSGCS